VNYLVNILYDNSKGVDIEVVLVIDVSKILEKSKSNSKKISNEQNGNTAQPRTMSPLKGNPK
jgi:hypothetical protein